MDKFKVGDLVEVPDSSMKSVPGVVVYFDKKQEKYLIRFGGSQQLFYSENEIVVWNPKSKD